MAVDTSQIPAIYVVINGPLEMSPGKIAAQTFQACERVFDEMHGEGLEDVRESVYAWKEHTTTIARIATTPTVWERVKSEVAGVVMVDEGYTEVPEGSETCFASWPLLRHQVPKILSNAKCPLYTRDEPALRDAFLAGVQAQVSSPMLGASEQETMEARRKAFRGWYAEALG